MAWYAPYIIRYATYKHTQKTPATQAEWAVIKMAFSVKYILWPVVLAFSYFKFKAGKGHGFLSTLDLGRGRGSCGTEAVYLFAWPLCLH